MDPEVTHWVSQTLIGPLEKEGLVYSYISYDRKRSPSYLK